MTGGDERAFAESYWLKKAKIDLLQRDPVDALNDAEALVRFMHQRLEAMLREH
ncbi:hypothetical protein [Palleronia sp.]|uniref:hypothetical protein n=1 Tax=Palleronia sp. TaxID=1940284 RepID=UPI0035C81EA0